MDLVRQTILEKIARDSGFDRSARRQGPWLVVGSSHFGEEVLLKPSTKAHLTIVALADRARPQRPWTIPGVEKSTEWPDEAGESRTVLAVESDSSLTALMGVVAAAARERRDRPLDRFQEKTAALPKGTEAERLVVVRVGQNVFRDALVEYWEGSCAVIGLETVTLLRASHCKPWADCESDAERLDVFNGFLLSPNLDAAFDGGWITFDDDGRIRISSQLKLPAYALMGLSPELRLRKIEPAHQGYLGYHRQHVYKE